MFKSILVTTILFGASFSQARVDPAACSKPGVRNIPSVKKECEELDRQKNGSFKLPCQETNNIDKCCFNNTSACKEAGERFLNQGSPKDAIKYLKPVCDSAITTSDDCDLLATAYFNSGEVDKAINYSKESCESYGHPLACKVLGFTYINKGKYREAEVIMENMCNTHSQKEFCIGKAYAQYEQGNIGEALKGFNEFCGADQREACAKRADASKLIKEFCLPDDFESSTNDKGISEWKCDLGENKAKAIEWYSLDKKYAEGMYQGLEKSGIWKYYDQSGKVTEESQQERAKKVAGEKKLNQQKEQKAQAAADAIRKEQQSELICKCQQYEASLNEMVGKEKEVGATVGVVNKQKLHKLGTQLVVVRDFIKYLRAQPESAKQCSKKYSLQVQSECGIEAGAFTLKK
ncbi:CDC27 family protein [Bdellovibrio sp. NC01]|uniref:CDC27 family protein n=1 Tax=Bdellovibrio sp. NC01 TaxID=2220073 RepID=UPI001156E75A|nr:CDC27 family protein [Bdellovibrio sp. NC01]QDK37200.1 hypothetical protein DOE51_06155 [Bdellovibrio sp. NC01]